MKARVVLFTSFLPNYQLITSWAERNGHEVVLVVTVPETGDRYGGGPYTLGSNLGKGASLLTTAKLRTVAAPVIAALAPDLVISAAFPRLIPAEILDVPTYGAVNLHPSALPAGRGPNPMRLVYEGASRFGATLHRTEAEFDTGAVLSQRERPLPADLNGPALLSGWLDMFAEVIEEGTARALAGERGTPQPAGDASYAGHFTDEEMVIDFTEPSEEIIRKVAALNLLVPRARIELPGQEARIRAVHDVPSDGRGTPGHVLATHADGWTVQAADRAVRIVTA